jgi:hypothetical protein
MSLEDFAKQDAVEADTRAALNRALKKIDSLKRDKEEMRELVYQAAHDAASSIKIPRITVPKKDLRRKAPEAAIAFLSDVQLGKTTPDYSSDVARERLGTYAEKVCELAEIQRGDHPVKECWVLNMGDFVEGELIFPGQAHRIDASLYSQAVADGPAMLAAYLRRLAASFEVVNVASVIGNHGAIGGSTRREMHPETNADAMAYEVARILTADEPRIRWTNPNVRPGERNWYATPTIMGKTWMIVHGDQIRGGFAGFPFYGLAKKTWGWYTSMDPFDYLAFGHWHTPTRIYLNGITAWCNGSTESSNTYAAESLAAAGEPSQWLLFQGTKGVTAEYLVHL